jgi:hypothetical protein
LVPKYRDVITTIQKELLEPVVTGTNKEATTQTAQPETWSPPSRTLFNPHIRDEYDHPSRIGQPRRGIGVGFDPDWYACFNVISSNRQKNTTFVHKVPRLGLGKCWAILGKVF